LAEMPSTWRDHLMRAVVRGGPEHGGSSQTRKLSSWEVSHQRPDCRFPVASQ
jgi:hypothetical protein